MYSWLPYFDPTVLVTHLLTWGWRKQKHTVVLTESSGTIEKWRFTIVTTRIELLRIFVWFIVTAIAVLEFKVHDSLEIGIQYLDAFLEKGWNVCLFDFSGSGLSEGSHIGLGHHEARDLDVMVNNMRISGNRRFLLWGRSMGAATSTLYIMLSHLLPQSDQVSGWYLWLRSRLPLFFSLVFDQEYRGIKITSSRFSFGTNSRLSQK